jgi:SAM-dependent methyltransferase
MRRLQRPPVPARTELAAPAVGPDVFNTLAFRQITNALAVAAPRHARGRLLDVGCGHKPYAPLLARFVDEHVGVDHADSPHELTAVDVIATAYDIPLEGGSFDTVLMTEVLEHLERPGDALAETMRLLRPGGKLILTTPFIWPLHEEPRDFYRYTPHGLRHLLSTAGFVDVEVTPLAGQWSTLALLSGHALRRSPARRLGPLFRGYVRARHGLAAWMDELHFRPWYSWNHMAVARKP